ncbi:MAG TPA: hypothetical protein VNJ47_06370 [Nevskiales bacterium]|nr:hypothetical protein [Nevskiales bacterium]
MLTSILLMLGTAVLSSLCTLGLAWWFYQAQLRERLDRRIEALAGELERRVHDGVKAAGIELLPAFQARVEAGFKDAMASLPEKGASAVAKASASLIGEGLNTLFGRREPSDKT